LVLGLIIIGPNRIPVAVKATLKFYKRIQKKFTNFKEDVEKEIGVDELDKDVFNELRMEELEEKNKSDND
tara:strand:+ start:761 stop:970 length:210 start_codon:yes stop_codon:yes gene_type:complete